MKRMQHFSSRHRRRLRKKVAEQLVQLKNKEKPDDDAPTSSATSTCASTPEDRCQSDDFDFNGGNELLHDTGEKTNDMDHRDDLGEPSAAPNTRNQISARILVSEPNCCFDDADENVSDKDELSDEPESNYADTSDYDVSSDERLDSSDCHGSIGDFDTEKEPGMFTAAERLLYNQAKMSQYEFLISFMSIFNQHCLTYSCADDLLKLFGQVLPLPNFVPQTSRTLIEKLVNYDASTLTHRCCGYCTMPLLDKSTCSQAECKSVSAPDSTFVEVRLDKQIQKLFSGIILCI